MRSLLDAQDRASILERAARLTPDVPPRWGSMSASQMMRHCVEALRGSLGDVQHRPLGRRLFRTRLVKFLVLRVLPFPKGAPTSPELRMMEPADLEAERQRLRELVERYAAPAQAEGRVEHPLFGVLTRREWSELAYKHLDHHLKQFGV